MAFDRLESVDKIKDTICDVIYKRGEKMTVPLKELFFQKISPRRMSSIGDINDLFDVLGRLELGSPNNLWAFHVIAEFLNDPALDQMISDAALTIIPEYERCHLGRNLYAIRRSNEAPVQPPRPHKKIVEDPLTIPAPSSSGNYSELQNRVFDLICCDIGKKWREFGRALKYHEADLDDFEARHSNNLRERIYAMLLDISQRHPSPQEIMQVICSALNDCRRVDLRKKVQRLMNKQM